MNKSSFGIMMSYGLIPAVAQTKIVMDKDSVQVVIKINQYS